MSPGTAKKKQAWEASTEQEQSVTVVPRAVSLQGGAWRGMGVGWVGGGGVRGKQLRCSQEASSQGLSEAFQRMTHPQQPGHLGWCSQSAGSKDILDVSKVTNVGKCHQHLWELALHTGS